MFFGADELRPTYPAIVDPALPTADTALDPALSATLPATVPALSAALPTSVKEGTVHDDDVGFVPIFSNVGCCSLLFN